MKRLMYLLSVVLIVGTLIPIGSVYPQTAAKKILPQAPITYRGDTDETIKRRAQWIEGARKEGKLVYWASLDDDLARSLIAEFNKAYP